MCNLQLPDHFFDKKRAAAPISAANCYKSYDPAYPSIESVLSRARLIAWALIDAGVPRRFLADAMQIVVAEAWLAIRAGRYRPDPTRPQDVIFEAWLREVARRQAKNVRRAWLRREVPVADPRSDQVPDPHDPHATLDARDALRALSALPARYRDALALAALGLEIDEVASRLGITRWTAVSRLRLGRTELARLLAGRGWRKP